MKLRLLDHSVLEKLLLDALPPQRLLFQQVQVVSSHPVHDEESDSHVPSHEHHPVHPDLGPHRSILQPRLVVLCESLPRVKLLD